MFQTSKTLGLAAVFLFVSAALLVLWPLVGGFTKAALIQVAAGVVVAGLGLGLLKGLRPIAWLAFFVALVAGIVALANAMDSASLPAIWHGLVAAADGLAAILLFLHLWAPAINPRSETP